MISFLREIRDIYFPTNETQTIVLIVTIAWIAVSIACRKQFGGFLSALKEVGLAILTLALLGWIHIGLLVATIAIALLQEYNVIPKKWSWLSTVIAVLAIVGFLHKIGVF